MTMRKSHSASFSCMCLICSRLHNYHTPQHAENTQKYLLTQWVLHIVTWHVNGMGHDSAVSHACIVWHTYTCFFLITAFIR